MTLTKILTGDCRTELAKLRDNSINCVVTSPPYWGLRNYNIQGQMGVEKSPQDFTNELASLFQEIHRVLRNDGTAWLNLGDSYAAGGQNSGSTPEQLTPKQRSNRGCVYERRVAPEGLKPKDLVGIPWRVAFALQQNGWYLRSEIIWAKPNGMPGSQQDRCTSSHETIFMLTKSAKYWSDFGAIKTPPKESTRVRLAQDVQAQAGSHRANAGGKTNGPMKAVGAEKSDKQRGHSRRDAGFNERWDKMEKSQQQALPAMMRDVWFVSPKGFKEAHFAVMSEEIARRCILAGCPENGVVLDPFCGAGTTGVVCRQHNRHFVGIELNPEYVAMAERRIELAKFPEPS